MAKTQISDVIVPEVFNPYVIERTTELTNIYMGGIVSNDPQLDALAMQGGKLINMPFWSDLTGADEVLSDSGSLTPAKITASQDVAALLMRGRAWSTNDLAKALSGDDPMRAIGNLVADYQARQSQSVLISTLAGVFADNVANDSSDMVIDIANADANNSTAAQQFTMSTLTDAAHTMGDNSIKLTAIAIHSDVEASLKKQNLITFSSISDQDLRQVPFFGGYRVIVDDNCPKVAGATSGFEYTSYLFGEGALGLGNGSAPVPVETDRDSLAGDDILIVRRHYVLHPRGVAFQSGSVAGSSPTNAEAALAANWSRVYDRNNVRIASLVSNVS